ncbi:DNA methyltransferase [Mycobacterium sp. KBS0706]|uniref:DNA cytosine methyltransferase n=1 Tax=Mycobacterium sp. KBS0706 TaxID=2578109 RepID=UPI00110FB549|nr:DNA cytosine methyltransferase [Mycobacterium sp. KBS0706]TSD89085.1 DNA methyltransferase [Mycobacterium sp. KBS0706]
MPDGDFRTDDLLPASAAPKLRKKMVADLFCGAGGTSTGAKKAFQLAGLEMILTCVNHWPIAIETHQRNHPEARHYCTDLESAKPEVLVPEGYLDLLLASPTCTFHSRARGGKPVNDQQRMDPWIIVRWCTTLRVRRLLIENVPEFVDWGPCDLKTGRPIPSRKGEYFRAWLKALRAVGMRMDWRIENCADHGDATTRSRFFAMGRSDGRRIRWPQPSHAPASRAVLLGLKPWRSAREIIDWSDKGRCVFERAVPLRPNTLRRTRIGAERFFGPLAPAYMAALDVEIERSIARWGDKAVKVERGPAAGAAGHAGPCLVELRGTGTAQPVDAPIPSLTSQGTHLALAMPFLVPQFGERPGQAPRTHAIDAPLPTVTSHGAGALAEPFLVPKSSAPPVRPADEPLPTMTNHGKPAVVSAEAQPFLLNRHGENGSDRVASVDEPMPTVTTRGAGYVAESVPEPFVLGQHGGAVARPVAQPLPTIAMDGAIALVEPTLVNLKGGSDARSIDEPTPTITAQVPHLAVAEPVVFPVNQSGGRARGIAPASEPLPTLLTRDSLAVAEPVIVQLDQQGGGGAGVRSAAEPLRTITTVQAQAMAEPVLLQVAHAGQDGRVQPIGEPIPSVTGKRGMGLVEPFVQPYYATGVASPVDEPLETVTTKARFGLAEAAPEAVADADAELRRLAAVRRLVLIDGVLHVLKLPFRMLKNPELARATSFSDEETEYEFCGTGEQVTKQIGNAVPVRTARALIGALMDIDEVAA